MIKLTLACAVLVAGCTDLATFSTACGDYELDPGEDCDEGAAPTERCDACRLVCDTGRECHGFAGYACGADGFCRAPSGRLASTFTELATLARSFTITDVDGDFYGDVISVSGTSLTVHYGDAFGDLAFEASTLIPALRGEPTFADIDGDASTDVVIPTADGVAAYSSPYQVLSPHPFILDVGNEQMCGDGRRLEGQPFEVFPLDDTHLAVLTSRSDNQMLGVAVINADQKTICADLASAQQVCNVYVGDLSGGLLPPSYVFGVDTYDTSTPGEPSKVVAFTSAMPGGGSCVLNIVRRSGMSTFEVTEIFENASVNREVALADLDGTGCPSVIDTRSVPLMAPREFRGSGAPGACVLAGASTPIALPAGASAIGAVRIDPLTAAGTFAADAIVTTAGVYAIRASRLGPTELYLSDRPLTSATSADIDADGDLDIIAIASGAEDVDLIQRASGDNFLLLRLDTVGAVTKFLVGDFDGNEIADIAYSELFVDSQHLNIAYGTRDRPLAPVDVGSFRYVVGLIPIQTPDSTDPDQIVDDLIVFDLVDPASTTPVMTLLHGSPQRTMQSFFDPRKGNSPTTTVFTGVAAGNFFPSPDSEPSYIDLIAIDGARVGAAGVWPLEGTAPGVFSYSKATVSGTDLGACASATDPAVPAVVLPKFCTDSARYTSWPRADDDDLVIGIDGGASGRRMVVLDPLDPGVGTAAPNATMTIGAFPLTAGLDGLDVRSLRSADLEGDGQAELFVAFGPAELVAAKGAIVRCRVGGDGIPLDCTDLAVEIPALAGMGCVDATVARVTPTGRPTPPTEPTSEPPTAQDLVIVCHREIAAEGNAPGPASKVTVSELFRIYHDGSRLRAASLIVQIGSIEVLQAGDVTGDGLDDILGIRINRTTGPSLVVFPQCPSNDDACGALAAQDEGP